MAGATDEERGVLDSSTPRWRRRAAAGGATEVGMSAAVRGGWLGAQTGPPVYLTQPRRVYASVAEEWGSRRSYDDVVTARGERGREAERRRRDAELRRHEVRAEGKPQLHGMMPSSDGVRLECGLGDAGAARP